MARITWMAPVGVIHYQSKSIQSHCGAMRLEANIVTLTVTCTINRVMFVTGRSGIPIVVIVNMSNAEWWWC